MQEVGSVLFKSLLSNDEPKQSLWFLCQDKML